MIVIIEIIQKLEFQSDSIIIIKYLLKELDRKVFYVICSTELD